MNFAGDILISVQRFSLDALAAQQLELAAAHGGRVASDTVVGGHERVLRQTVVGMIKGAELREHNNPGEATLHVLRGRVRLTSEGNAWEGGPVTCWKFLMPAMGCWRSRTQPSC